MATPSFLSCELPSTSGPLPPHDSGYGSATKSEIGTASDPLSLHRPCVAPAADPALVGDERLLYNLLRAEGIPIRIVSDYWATQKELKPYMRGMVVEWMRDVCSEEEADLEVFPLAVSCLDRFLGQQPVYKTQLQGLGAACLFVASKVKQTLPFSAAKLVVYTDNSVQLGELMSWELLVLSKLDWDVSAATGVDFVELLLARMPEPAALLSRVRPAALHLLKDLLQDFHLASLPPHLQAAVAVAAAGVRVLGEPEALPQLAASLTRILGLQMDTLAYWLSAAEAVLHSASDENNNELPEPSLPETENKSTNMDFQGPDLFLAA